MTRNKKALLRAVQRKFGYDIPITRKEFTFIFRTDNIRGIQTRYLEVVHAKAFKRKIKKVM